MQTHTPEISVIVPFYNAEPTLRRALNSIYAQSFANFECIMIDNNSTDASGGIAQEFANNNSNYRLIRELKQGVVYASNAGSNISRGKYIARMDADDESCKNRLQLQYDFLEKNMDYGAVGGLVEYVPHKENTQGFASFVLWANTLISYEEIFLKRFMELPIINPSAMWRKNIAQQLGEYQQGDFPEDYQMWLRWLNAGVKVGKVPYKVLKWYDSEQRLTRSDDLYSIDSFYKAKSPFLNSFLQKINPFYPKVAVWGASKTARKRADMLAKYGVEICCYIDITKKRQLYKEVLYYEDIPEPGMMFILIYVKQEAMRNRVEKFLISRDYVEGVNFLFVS